MSTKACVCIVSERARSRCRRRRVVALLAKVDAGCVDGTWAHLVGGFDDEGGGLALAPSLKRGRWEAIFIDRVLVGCAREWVIDDIPMRRPTPSFPSARSVVRNAPPVDAVGRACVFCVHVCVVSSLRCSCVVDVDGGGSTTRGLGGWLVDEHELLCSHQPGNAEKKRRNSPSKRWGALNPPERVVRAHKIELVARHAGLRFAHCRPACRATAKLLEHSYDTRGVPACR